MEEKEEKGFVVKDRRKVSLDDAGREPESGRAEPKEARKEEQAKEKFEEASRVCGKKSNLPLPEVSFSTFIVSLSSSALFHLGEIPDPETQETQKDLPLAKQIIDTLGMLQEKTQGNLGSEEDRLLKTVLYDLRLRYVQKCGG